jgi:hypothetical protein
VTETAPKASSHRLTPAEEPSPEPVLGGAMDVPAPPPSGVFVGAGFSVGGTGVAVFGVSVGVAVGVWVRSFTLAVADGSTLAVGSGVGDACCWAAAAPMALYAIPNMSAPAATTATPIVIRVFDLINSPP